MLSTIVIRSYEPPTTVKGRVVKGDYADTSISAVVQTSSYKQLLNLPADLQKTKAAITIWSDVALKVSDEKTNDVSDEIIHNKETYTVYFTRDWSQLDIAHFESIAIKNGK